MTNHTKEDLEYLVPQPAVGPYYNSIHNQTRVLYYFFKEKDKLFEITGNVTTEASTASTPITKADID
tara:strand:- start:75 stop:275 length:201 start_codon:yes stop_codon:yes gene_type:complete